MNILSQFQPTDDAPHDRPRAAVRPCVVDIEIHRGIAALEEEWKAFEARAAGTFYQTYAWCAAWQATIGKETGAEPVIVTGRDQMGRLLFLLPFSLSRRRGCRLLEWLGSEQIGYGYGLYDRRFLPEAGEWFAHEGWRILEAAGPIDTTVLQKMPARLHGLAHPLTAWFTLAGRNTSYVLALTAPYDVLYAAKRSRETRRSNKKRDAKLAACGALDFGLPKSASETHALLDEMFDRQQARLEEAGIRGVFGDRERRFIHRLATMRGAAGPALLPYRLKIGGDTAAVMLGGCYANSYWALISSLGDGPYRRHSPGDAALRRLIEACCHSGFSTLDFGSGDTAYKDHWADETIQLHDAVRAVTPRGYVLSLALLSIIAAKRLIKRTPALWAAATWLRRAIRR